MSEYNYTNEGLSTVACPSRTIPNLPMIGAIREKLLLTRPITKVAGRSVKKLDV